MIKLGIWENIGIIDNQNIVQRSIIVDGYRYWAMITPVHKSGELNYILNMSHYFKCEKGFRNYNLMTIHLDEAKIKADQILKSLNIDFVDSKYEIMA